MKLAELKDKINNKNLSDDFLVLVCEENHFLANQYVEAICKNRECDIIKINSIYEPITSALSLVVDYENNINLLVTESFEERSDDYSQFTNTIVICDKVDKKLEAALTNYLVKIPKLADWCIKDYIKVLCPNLSQESIDWLYTVTNGDIYRILNELDKVLLFDRAEHQTVLNALRFDYNTDLYSIQIFDLANAIAKNDKTVLLDFFRHSKNCNFDPNAISTLVLNNLKKALFVLFNSGANLAALDITPKVANAIKYYYKGISQERLLKSIEFLSNIDFRLKSSELDLTKERLLDYLICNLLSF